MTDRGVPPRRSPRKPIARSKKRIPRYAELPRPTKRIKARKADPAKRRWASHRCKPFTEWLKGLPCSVSGESVWRYSIVDPAHIKTRATGGGDLYNAIPLSREAHEEQHRIGWPAFERKYGIDARAIAADLTDQFLAMRH